LVGNSEASEAGCIGDFRESLGVVEVVG